MTLVKTSLLNSIAVGMKLLTMLGINKLLALYVGPAGYAALGQFQNAMTMITTFASGAINTGVTKYTAEHYANPEAQQSIWRTAGTIAFIGTILTSVLIGFFRRFLALSFLGDAGYANVFLWFSLALFFFVFNALLLAILNGKKEISRYVMANIIGSLFSLLMTTLLVIYYGLYGALIALSLYQSIAFFGTLLLCYNASWFKISYLIGSFDKAIAKRLANYTLMALSTAVCVPISHILIRNHLGNTLSWEAAGYWEAMWRLSGAYLMLITTTLSVYYLPRLSEIKGASELKEEILQGYRVILPCAIVAAFLIYICRDLLIQLLFSEQFYPVRVLFLGQVIGDILKIGSWILAFVMLGKAMTRYFIATEIIFSASFYCLVVLMTNAWGLHGVAWAYALNYLFYWVCMYCLIFKKISREFIVCQ